MRLTTKGRFAVTAMIDLTRHQETGPVSLAGISERQDISIASLRKNLVKSIRGPGGGYLLANDAADITVADIVFAVDEPLDVTRCGGNGNCAKGSIKCISHNLWASLNEKIIDYLESVPLSELSQTAPLKAKKKSGTDSTLLFAKPAK